MRKSNALSKILSIFVVTSMILSGMSLPWAGGTQEAFAKDIDNKNEAQKQACDAVIGSEAPAGYKDELGDKSVFRGGNTHSATSKTNILDSDINDFATPLPYGDTYIDTSKLNWDNPDGFAIDIKDPRFIWISSTKVEDPNGSTVYNNKKYTIQDVPRKDKNGFESTSDPFETGNMVASFNGGSETYIAYMGPLDSYLDDIKGAASATGKSNVIEADDGDYLYSITYFNAVTLPNGTRGNLVLKMKRVEIESSFTVNENDKNGVYDKALIQIQSPNTLGVDIDQYDEDGNPVNKYDTVVLSADEVRPIVTAANNALTSNKLDTDAWIKDKTVRHAAGGIYDLDIEVLDSEMNPVNGTISYAAHDVDFGTYQNVWGRTVNDADKYKFSEGLAIINGSKSYALVPNYRHDGDGETLNTGWMPVSPSAGVDADGNLPDGGNPLNVERITGTTQNNADGVRFSSKGIVNVRDKNGSFENVPFNETIVQTALGQNITTGGIINKNLSANLATSSSVNNAANKIRRLYYGRLKAEGYQVGNSWKNVTAEMLYDYLGDASWKIERGDANGSEAGLPVYDTGFAVLLDAKQSTLRWSGSRMSGAGINTSLFDSSLYTYVETTHGTGGGIYLERYDLSNGCETIMDEGTVTMGRHADSTVTAVPEKGYRVSRILIGDTNYGHGSDVSGLRDYTEYVIDGNDIKVNGSVVGSFNGPNKVSDFEDLNTGVVVLDGFSYDVDGSKQTTDKKIRIERNKDGTVDVTLPDIDNPMHVHADFDADYYFYKIWIGGDPVELNLIASPAGSYPTKVTIPVPTGELDADNKPIYQDVEFEINGSKYTAKEGRYNEMGLTGVVFTLANGNNLEYVETDPDTGEETLAIRPNVVLLGDKFVSYTTDPDTGESSISAEYPITMEDRVADWQGPEAKTFKVNNTREYTADGYVTELGKDDPKNTLSPGNIVWKIKYPSEGVEALGWPALPVEEEPAAANHDASNHHERNYWFVIEEVPNWSTEGYSNENADVPGKVDPYYDYYKDANWYAATKADLVNGNRLVHEEYEHGNAYMSVFKDGGEITNVPSVIVRGKKEWNDKNNIYKYRKDIWLHIDAEVEGNIIEDILPPQKISSGAAGNGLIKTWGNKKSYSTGLTSVKVVGTAKDVPSSAQKQNDGSYINNGTTYWVNELMKNDADKKVYTYSIRETLDRKGDIKVDDPSDGLHGYTSKDEAVWTELSTPKQDAEAFSGQDKEKISGQDVVRYSGEVKNKLETVEFDVTKVWNDANNKDSVRPSNGAVTYTIKKKSGEGDATVVTSLPVEKSVMQGNDDITSDYSNGKITVKTHRGGTVKFSNLPKYDTVGQEITYTVEEAAISGYRTDITGNMEDGYTVTNTQKTEVFVEKVWEDANNQDGVRPQTVEFELLKGTTPTGTTLKLSDSNNWKGKFSNLDKYYGTTEIRYSVKEDDAAESADYTASAVSGTGTQSDPFTITNTREPEKITIEATKVWNDTDENPGDKYGIRFEADFKLLGDGVQVGATKTVATGNDHDQNMTAEWEVYKYRNGGEEIIYNVIEDKDPTSPYSVEVTGSVEDGFIVTNVYPPETEYRTVKRTITYTYLKPDGQRASDTVIQEVKLKRNPIKFNPEDGTYDWSGWEFVEPDPDKRETSGVDSPDIKGWDADRDVDEWVIDLEDPQDAYENVIYEPQPPEGTPKESYGAPGQPQTGKPPFEVTTPNTPSGSPNKIVKYELLDDEGNPAETVDAFDKDGNKVGKYTIDDDGNITFTPTDPTYIGVPTRVNVRGTDSNGKSAETYYQPHIKDNTKTVTRTITYEYEDGTAVKDDKGKNLVVEQSVTFTGTVDPETGEVIFPEGVEDTMPKVDSDPIDGYTVDQPSVPEITVTPKDDDISEKVIYSPKGITAKPDETYGLPGQSQTGTPTFEMETPTMPDGTPNKVTPKLIDPKTGKPCDTVTIPGQGTYKLNSNGTITFTPVDGFVGNPDPVVVEGTDRNGKKARTKYTPHIVDPVIKDTATRKIHYTYVTKRGKKVTGDVTQTVNIYKHAKKVDPKTGKVLEWGDWEPTKFPAVKNPDDKVNGKIWYTNDSAGEQTVTKPGKYPDVHVVYKKLPTTIYVDPATGRTIQKTLPFLDENTEPDPPEDPTREGYKFVGWDRIEEYDVNGDLVNVRYEAKWEKIESGSSKTKKGANTGDDTFILMDIAVLLSAALAIFLMIRRRRKYDR